MLCEISVACQDRKRCPGGFPGLPSLRSKRSKRIPRTASQRSAAVGRGSKRKERSIVPKQTLLLIFKIQTSTVFGGRERAAGRITNDGLSGAWARALLPLADLEKCKASSVYPMRQVAATLPDGRTLQGPFLCRGPTPFRHSSPRRALSFHWHHGFPHSGKWTDLLETIEDGARDRCCASASTCCPAAADPTSLLRT